MTANWTFDQARELQARILAAVAVCPYRGPVLPVSQQPECGCAELTACRAGKGQRPGKVTLANCMECAGPEIESAFSREGVPPAEPPQRAPETASPRPPEPLPATEGTEAARRPEPRPSKAPGPYAVGRRRRR